MQRNRITKSTQPNDETAGTNTMTQTSIDRPNQILAAPGGPTSPDRDEAGRHVVVARVHAVPSKRRLGYTPATAISPKQNSQR
jgi:hypothetical protein